MAKTSEKYEVLYIIDQDVDEEGVKALVEKFTNTALSLRLTNGESVSLPILSTISPKATTFS